MKTLKYTLLAGLFGMGQAFATLPYLDQPFEFRQPNGQTITIYLSGNDLLAEQRLASGELVIFDNHLKGYSYARVSTDGKRLNN